MKDGKEFSMEIVILLICVFAGWLFAHWSIADECKRLGGFYVGESVYICTEKE